MGPSIGERVRSYRVQRRLTQTVLADLVGRSSRWVSQLERGGVDLRVSDAVLLAGALGIDLADLVQDRAPREGRARRGGNVGRPAARGARTAAGLSR